MTLLRGSSYQVADTAPYIAAVKKAADAARDFAAANAQAVAAVRELQDAMNGLATNAASSAVALRTTAGAESDMRDQSMILLAILQELRDQSLLLGVAFTYLDDKLASLVAHAAAASTATSTLGNSMTGLAAKTVAAGAAQTAAQGIWVAGWRLTGNIIHWIVAGTAEFLAVALPAAIAAASAALVMFQGVVEFVARRMNALFTATEATGAMIGKTTGDVLGLGHAFQTAQNAANPVAYMLLGEYINAARASMTNFAGAGLQVAHVIGELGARIAVDLNTHAAEFASLIANMVPDLVMFGQILGNIGHALLNFAAAMPGLAEVLLKIADAISRVILWLSELPRWVIMAVMAFEEFNRWGGLVITIMGRMGLASSALATGILNPLRAVSILRNVLGLLPMLLTRIGGLMATAGASMGFFGADVYAAGVAMEDFGKGAVAAIGGLSAWEVVLVTVAAVGLGILIDKSITARTSVQAFGDSLQKTIAAASNVNIMGVLADSFGKLNVEAQKASASVNDTARAVARQNQAAGMALSATKQFSDVQQQLMVNSANVAGGADKISRAYGTTFAQSLALADLAGVKLATTQITLGRNANIAGMEVQSMVLGYQKLDQVGGTLGADMNVLAVQAGLAGTKVQQLNGAWDQFLQNATGVTSNLATMNQDLTQIGNTGVAVGGRFRVFAGTAALAVGKAADAMKSFSGTGAQVWQNFDAAVTQANTLFDQFRIAAAYGGIGVTQFNGVIANTVASMLPFATHSATAVLELSALAQEAGGPATSNFKTLKAWVEANGISGKQFNKDIQTMTGSLSNAGKAAAQFATDLQQQMQQQLASALLGTQNLNQKVQQFQQAVLKAGGQISASSPQYQALYNLLRASGLTAQQARTEMQLLQKTIDSLHAPPPIKISVQTLYTSYGQAPPGTGTGGGMLRVPTGQHGGMVHGPAGTDVIPALLTAGEAILTARAVAALGGPMSITNLNTAPSPGVLHSAAGIGTTALTLNLGIQNKFDNQVVNTAQRRENLIYNRRNPSNNLALRAR